jgi:hypothetical protein
MTDVFTDRRPVTARTSIAARERLVPRATEARWSPTATASREVLSPSGTEWEVQFDAHWLGAILRRISALSHLPRGWDSYGGERLQPGAVGSLLMLLTSFQHVIQTEPSVSLTTEGGLLCEWDGRDASLELTANPDGSTHVYFSEPLSGREWEGTVTECSLLEKWLWQSSSVA